jgi:hypothetical protein
MFKFGGDMQVSYRSALYGPPCTEKSYFLFSQAAVNSSIIPFVPILTGSLHLSGLETGGPAQQDFPLGPGWASQSILSGRPVRRFIRILTFYQA